MIHNAVFNLGPQREDLHPHWLPGVFRPHPRPSPTPSRPSFDSPWRFFTDNDDLMVGGPEPPNPTHPPVPRLNPSESNPETTSPTSSTTSPSTSSPTTTPTDSPEPTFNDFFTPKFWTTQNIFIASAVGAVLFALFLFSIVLCIRSRRHRKKRKARELRQAMLQQSASASASASQSATASSTQPIPYATQAPYNIVVQDPLTPSLYLNAPPTEIVHVPYSTPHHGYQQPVLQETYGSHHPHHAYSYHSATQYHNHNHGHYQQPSEYYSQEKEEQRQQEDNHEDAGGKYVTGTDGKVYYIPSALVGVVNIPDEGENRVGEKLDSIEIDKDVVEEDGHVLDVGEEKKEDVVV